MTYAGRNAMVPQSRVDKLRLALAAFEQAEEPSPSPAWTSEAPSAEGIYWIFRVEGPRLPRQRPTLVNVATDRDGKLWLIADWGDFKLEPESGHSDGFVWQGPIAVPVAP